MPTISDLPSIEVSATRTQKLLFFLVGFAGGNILPGLAFVLLAYLRLSNFWKLAAIILAYSVCTVALWRRNRYVGIGATANLVIWLLFVAAAFALWFLLRLGL
jgi:hypothetical protein